jgi:hypothetical protein
MSVSEVPVLFIPINRCFALCTGTLRAPLRITWELFAVDLTGYLHLSAPEKQAAIHPIGKFSQDIRKISKYAVFHQNNK